MKKGLWSILDPGFLHTSYVHKCAEKFWKLIKDSFYDSFAKFKPNDAHHVLAELEDKGLLDVIVTHKMEQ